MADGMSVGSGGGFRLTSCAFTDCTGPTRWTKASRTWMPAPVIPPPGDSSAEWRHAPKNRPEFSLLAWPSMYIGSRSSPRRDDRLHLLHAGPEPIVLAERQHHTESAASIDYPSCVIAGQRERLHDCETAAFDPSRQYAGPSGIPRTGRSGTIEAVGTAPTAVVPGRLIVTRMRTFAQVWSSCSDVCCVWKPVSPAAG
jgi:hypothetical protein